MNKILLIGCGNMGSALLEAWSKKTTNHFTVVDPQQYLKLRKKFQKIHILKDINQIKSINKFDIIIFAIKPQISDLIMKKISNFIFKKNTLFISVVAGKKISFYNNFLPLKNQLVRVMPNLPAIVEESMSCLVANKYLSKSNKNKVNLLFSKAGKVLWLKNEKELDKVTAISGSGPAYFYLFIEYFEKACQKLGFTETVSKNLVFQTALGSLKLLSVDKRSAQDLRKNIAIKGGTTEAALKILMKNNDFNKIFSRAIMQAHKKAIVLGKK